MFLLASLPKSKFFTPVVRAALVSHLCCSRLTCVDRVTLVLHLCRSCRTRALVSDTHVVN